MTIAEAQAGLERGVVYHNGTRFEDGVIVAVGNTYVHILFDGDRGAKAVRPEQIEFANDAANPQDR